MPVSVLTMTAHAACKNCGLRIVRLAEQPGKDDEWMHYVEGKGYQYHCPGAPVAEPVLPFEEVKW